MQNLTTIQLIIVWALPVLLAITVHEVSHGYVAHKLGDNTAYAQGRLTLNPFKHIDLFGTILVPFLLLALNTGFVFGWAKPVPVVSKNLRRPKTDMALVAAAGPISNFIMALGWALVMKLGVVMAESGMAASKPIFYMGNAGIMINLLLGLLNLIPIPPLDGSRVVSSVLPPKYYMLYNKVEPFGFFILLAMMLSGAFAYIIEPPLVYFVNLLLELVAIK